MTITATLLDSGALSTSAPSGWTTNSTSSVTISANKLGLIGILSVAIDGDGANIASPSAVAIGAVSFTKIKEELDTTNGVALSVWRCMPGSNTTAAIGVTWARGQQVFNWSVLQIDGVATGGTNGSAAVVQSVSTKDLTFSTNTVTATLAAFGSGSNGAASFHGWIGAGPTGATATPDTGWTEEGDIGTDWSGAAGGASIEGQFRADNDTTAKATWSANGFVYAAAVELAATSTVVDTPITVTNASLSLSGQDVNLVAIGNYTLPVTEATLNLSGQDAPFQIDIPWSEAALTLTGQSISLIAGVSVTLGVTEAALSLTGQSVTLTADFDYSLSVDSAALALTGQDVVFSTGAGSIVISVDQASLFLTAQNIDISPSFSIPSSGIPRRKRHRGIRRLINIGR